MVEANLFEFLHTIPTEPLNEIGEGNPPLRTFVRPPKTNELAGLPYAPYAIVEEEPGNVDVAFFGGSDVMTKLVNVTLHQAPNERGDTPSRLQMGRLVLEIVKAVHFVKSDVVAEHFISLERVAEYPPTYDPETKGLFAAVRFRVRYLRE